ncbi:MAG: hypothetical protein QXE61_05595 [Nitrososphaerota archaeon]
MKTTLLDTTLREGELYRCFKLPVKLAVAENLLRIGIKRIELTLAYPPRTSIEDLRKILKFINSLNGESVIHCRACKEDIENAGSYEAWGIAIYMALSKIHVQHKFNTSNREELLDKLAESVEYARQHGFKYIRTTVEDSSRIFLEEGIDKVVEFVETLRRIGATIVSLPDTAGLLTPPLVRSLFSEIRKRVDMPVSVHFHDDYGYASANTVEAILAGVDEAHVSILGIGDRNGIADLYQVVAPLMDIHGLDLGVKRELLRELYLNFSKLTGIQIPFKHPLSDEARTIRAGVHQFMVSKAPEGYLPQKKLEHDFKKPLFEATPFISKKLLEKILENSNINSAQIKELAEYIGMKAYDNGGKLSISMLYHLLREKGIEVSRERLVEYFGYEKAYTLIKLRERKNIEEVFREILNWREIESAEKVQGDLDIILRVKLNPGEEKFLEKLSSMFGRKLQNVSILRIID